MNDQIIISDNGESTPVDAEFIGAFPIEEEPSTLLYKHGDEFYGAKEGSNKAFQLVPEAVIDLAVDCLQHQLIENETLFKTIADLCIQDQKIIGKDFPYLAVSNNPPSHARFAFVVVNDYGYCPNGAINPIYHCFAVSDVVSTPFGFVYLTDDEETIVVTRTDNANDWNAVEMFIPIAAEHSGQNAINRFPESDELKDALSKLNVDLPFDLT